MRKIDKFVCPHCRNVFPSLNKWVDHVRDDHGDILRDLPNGLGDELNRYFYYLQTGKDHGECIVCKNPTEFNPINMKYFRFCKNPKCKEKYREEFKKRMNNKYGKTHLLNDPEQQRKMLKNRKISGVYEVPHTNIKIGYVGSYELDFLKTIISRGLIDPNDIMSPSPHTYWYDYVNPDDREHEGKHFYIPDFYIPSLNLEVEIKQATNMHPKMIKVDRVKELQKDNMMRNQKNVHYIKIVEKNYSELNEFLADAERGVAVEAAKFVGGEKVERWNLSDYVFEELNDQVNGKEFETHVPGFKRFFISSGNKGELMLDGSKRVGYWHTVNIDNTTWLSNIYIDPEHRMHRLGTQLVSRILRKTNFTNVALPKDALVLERILKHHGFIEYGKEYLPDKKYNILFMRMGTVGK